MTKLYFHALSSTLTNLPTTTKSATVSDKNADAQTVNRQMDTIKGTSQTSVVLNSLADTASDDYFFTKFVSDPLKGITSISANTWNYAYAVTESNVGANFPVSGSNLSCPAVAYVWRPSTQTKVGNIVDALNACSSTFSEPASANTEVSEFGTFAGSAVSSVQDGDVIVFEFWARTTQAAATSRTDTFYFDGATETNNTGTTVSDHASYIETPQTLAFFAIKRPIDSITFSDAVTVANTPSIAQTNVSAKKGTITLDATGTVHDQSFTGVGFQPKALIFFGVPTTAETYAEGYSQFFGFTDGTTSSCVSGAAQDNINQGSVIALASHMMRNDACICLISPAGTPAEIVRGQLKTLDSDGFTITWNVKNTTQYILHYVAIGGSDITAKVASTTVGTTSTGNKAYTGVGFKPDAAIFLSAYDTTAANTLSDHAPLNIGAASGATQQFGLTAMTIKGFATGSSNKSAASVFSATEVLHAVHYTANATAVTRARGSLASFDSDGFTLNHVIAPGLTSIPFSYLAIKGGYWSCGVFSQKTSTGTQINSFPRQLDPEMSFFVGNNSATLEGLIDSANQIEDLTSIGAADGSLNQGAISADMLCTNSSTITAGSMISLTSAVIRLLTPNTTATLSTTNSEADINDMSTFGQFTLDWTTANATLRKIGWLTLGKAPGISAGLTRVLGSDTLKYSLLQQVKQSDTLKYNLLGRIIHSDTLKYNLLKQIKQSDTLKYSLLKQVKQPNTLKYNLIGRILHSNTLKYNLIGRIKKQNTLKYNLIGRITHQNTLKYNLIGRIVHANTLKYNLWKQVKANRTLKYNLLKAILHANTLKYNLLSKTVHANTLKYSLLKQITHQNTLKYNLIGRIIHANTLKYSLLKQIKQSNTLKYSLLKQITHANTLKYALLKQVKKANTLLWSLAGVLSRILHANTLKYNLIGRVTQQKTLKYNILKQVRSLTTYDDFESGTYTLTFGSTSPNGKWTNVFVGGPTGSTGVRFASSASSNVMWLKPTASVIFTETHASQVKTTAQFSDFDATFKMRTVQQLRQNDPPKPWEVAWIIFRYTDADHHYYFHMKSDNTGCVFARKDYTPHVNANQILSTPAAPITNMGQWYNVRIRAIANHFWIWVDGVLIIDLLDDGTVGNDTSTSGLPPPPTATMYSGSFDPYVEDAEVEYDDLQFSHVLKYSLLKQVKQSNTLKWNLLKQVLKSATLLYSLLAQLARILHANTLKYGLIGRVTHQNTLKYNLLKQVLANRTTKYSVLKQVLANRTLKYSLIGRIVHANRLNYSLLKQITRPNTLKYSLVGRIVHQSTLKYSLLKQVLANRTLKYSLLKQVKHSNTLLWSLTAVLSRIVHANTLKYSLIQRLTHQNTLKFNVLVKRVHSNTLKYNLLKQVLANRTLKYSLIQRIKNQAILKYNVLKQIKQPNTLKYSLLKQIKQSRTLKYSLLQRIRHQFTLKYNVISFFTRIFHSLTLKWSILAGQVPGKGGGYIIPGKGFKIPKLKQILYPVYSPETMRRIERRRKLRLYQPLAVIPAFSISANQVIAPFVITDINNGVSVKFAIAPIPTKANAVLFSSVATLKISEGPKNRTIAKFTLAPESLSKALDVSSDKLARIARLSKVSKVLRIWLMARELLHQKDSSRD